MKVLVTGSAGFIGSAVVTRLLKNGLSVIGIDNHNSYYCNLLKEARIQYNLSHTNYSHYRFDLLDIDSVQKIFIDHDPTHVIHLAAQAGVRYSVINPNSYIQNNINAFCNVLELCRNHSIKHLIYASSSSVYGGNTSLPFSTHDDSNHPLSLYAATKRSNELMAHSYSSLFNLSTTGLRFFTVYGPWGRPDMALFKFTKALLNGEKIQIYNNGSHIRDFTYIDDIVDGILLAFDNPATSNIKWDSNNPDPASSNSPWRIFNLGAGRPISLLNVLEIIEFGIGKKFDIEYLPMQLGDVENTFADMSEFSNKFNFQAKTSIREGIFHFIEWYKTYYNH